jgi:histidinol dehydrogenase
MKLYFEHMLSQKQRARLTQRPGSQLPDVARLVGKLCLDVKRRGDAAVRQYTKRFDRVTVRAIRVSEREFADAKKTLSFDFIEALRAASTNIRAFHEQQRSASSRVSIMEGVTCWRETRPIERVGLYVPAGSAPLPSTVLMLGIPAKLAGCPEIIICSPPAASGSVYPSVLEAAAIIGIKDIYKIGGAQAIAAMAYGTKTIPKADKIFGPGNRYVTAAKQFVSTDADGAAVDLQAGPSEVLIVADDSADPAVVVYDLISQAEHDPDAQPVLVTTSDSLAKTLVRMLADRAAEFDRREIISLSLNKGFIFVAETMQSALRFSDEYAPEHLIINTRNPEIAASLIKNAGSVFIGPFSPVTAGDYASGTNHTLPTGGTARWSSGVSLDSFQKKITFQALTQAGLKRLAPTLNAFAATEGLPAHARAVNARLSSSQD